MRRLGDTRLSMDEEDGCSVFNGLFQRNISAYMAREQQLKAKMSE